MMIYLNHVSFLDSRSIFIRNLIRISSILTSFIVATIFYTVLADFWTRLAILWQFLMLRRNYLQNKERE